MPYMKNEFFSAQGVCAMYCILLFYESGVPTEFARFVKEAKKYNINVAIIHSKADLVLRNYHRKDRPHEFPTIDQKAANRVVKISMVLKMILKFEKKFFSIRSI
jgi:hypothetical protein